MASSPGSSEFSHYRAFILTRRAPVTMLLVLFLGAATAWFGLRQAAVPSGTPDGGSLPAWRLLAMGVGILPALGLHSPLADIEAAGTSSHRAVERCYLASLAAASVGLFLAVAALGLPGDLLRIMLRSLVAWLGLALVSGRVFGWRLAWVMPSVMLCVLTYWGGAPEEGSGGAWWEFSARPAGDLASLGLSATLLGFGVLAYSATPWRWTRAVQMVAMRRGGRVLDRRQMS